MKKDPEKHRAYMREYNSRPEVKAKKLAAQRRHRASAEGKAMERGYAQSEASKQAKARYRRSEQGKLRKREAHARRMASDTGYRLSHVLRARLRHALCGEAKAATTHTLLGCSIEQLRIHIEAQWTEGMTWASYGTHGWHIDHIKPCASYDLTIPAQQAECFHYTNLQPMWAKDNLAKGSTLPPTT